MKMKLGAASLAMILASALTAHAGCAFHKQQQAMSCGDGTVYDADAGACVPTTG